MLNVSHWGQLTWKILWEGFRKLLQNWFNVLRNLLLAISISLSSYDCITSRTLSKLFSIWSWLIKFISILLCPYHPFFRIQYIHFVLTSVNPFSSSWRFGWFSIIFTLFSLWTNEHWLVRPYMVTSKSNNHGRPKMIWPTFMGSMSPTHYLCMWQIGWEFDISPEHLWT